MISLSNMVILHVHAGHQGVTLNPPSNSTPRRNELVKPMKDSTYGTSTSTCNISSPCRHGSTLGNQIRYTKKQPKMALQWWLLSGYMIPWCLNGRWWFLCYKKIWIEWSIPRPHDVCILLTSVKTAGFTSENVKNHLYYPFSHPTSYIILLNHNNWSSRLSRLPNLHRCLLGQQHGAHVQGAAAILALLRRHHRGVWWPVADKPSVMIWRG